MQHKKEVKVLLAESFKELVLEKQVEKITIKEITDRAGVIRVTFYNHFQDKYELLEWIFREEVIESAKVLLWNNMQGEALIFVFNKILNNREFYIRVARTEGQNSFPSIVYGCFFQIFREYIIDHVNKTNRKQEWFTPEWAGEFYAQSISHLLLNWIRTGMKEHPESMVEMYQYFSTHSLTDLSNVQEKREIDENG